MTRLLLGQQVRFFYRDKWLEGTLAEYHNDGHNTRYRIETPYKSYWRRRKFIDGYIPLKQIEKPRYVAPTDPAIFEITLE